MRLWLGMLRQPGYYLQHPPDLALRLRKHLLKPIILTIR